MKSSVLLILVLISAFTVSFGKKYQCEISDDGKQCTISGLKLSKDDYEIEPVASNLRAIEKFELKTSTVPILTSRICNAMPNLKFFVTDSVPFEEIEENAFHQCKGLTQIVMVFANFLIIPKNSFKGLRELKILSIIGGNFPVFDVDLTDLKDLNKLVLSSLNITEFSPEILREQRNLKELYLYSNSLYDLSVEELHVFTPKLKEIHLLDNNFKCSRLKEIITILEQKNIELRSFHVPEYLRKREYTPEKIHGVHCLSEYQWMQEFIYFHALKFTQKELSSMNFNYETLKNTLNKKISILETSIDVFYETIETLKSDNMKLFLLLLFVTVTFIFSSFSSLKS